jgi:hypothetical protein
MPLHIARLSRHLDMRVERQVRAIYLLVRVPVLLGTESTVLRLLYLLFKL